MMREERAPFNWSPNPRADQGAQTTVEFYMESL